MYYISGKVTDNEYMVTDTTDNVTEIASRRDIVNVIVEKGITIGGVSQSWDFKPIPNAGAELARFLFLIKGNCEFEDNSTTLVRCYSSNSEIILPEIINFLGSRCFDTCEKLESIIIRGDVEELPYCCFNSCSMLQKISLPANLKKLGACCFAGCSMLRKISLPANLKKLEPCCFQDCSMLQEISLPANLKKLGNFCFEGCTCLKEITIPDTVDEVGFDCFYECNSLKEIKVHSERIADLLRRSGYKREIVKYVLY